MAASEFTPTAVPRIAVAADGAHAAIVERGVRVAFVRVADGTIACELALPSGESDVAWIGSRAIVVATTEAHTDVSLVDALAPDHKKLAEIRLETPMRLAAATDAHALLLGTRTAAVLTGGEAHVAPYQFLARTMPTVVGVAGNLFVVAMPGTIEEWDPISRMPKRRLRLPRAATITSLGGSERVLWMTTLQEPARLDVLPIVNRGQAKAHDLPESIKSVHGHPHSDVVVCIGAETGRVYAIDLDTRGRLRTIATGLERTDVAALAMRGRDLTMLAARAGQPIAIVSIASIASAASGASGDREAESATAPSSTSDELPPIPAGSSLFEATQQAARAIRESIRGATPEGTATHGRDPSSSSLYGDGTGTHGRGEASKSRGDGTGTHGRGESSSESHDDGTGTHGRDESSGNSRGDSFADPRGGGSSGSLWSSPGHSLGAAARESFGDRPPMSPAAAEARAIAREASPERAPTAWSEGASELMAKLASLRAAGNEPGSPDAPQRATWRDDAGAWARAVASGTFDRAAPPCPSIEVLAERFALPEQLVPALVLLYGSHLAGVEGAAPMDVARVLGRRWDDALGRGKLAEVGIARHVRSRVALAPAVLRALDELPVATGRLIGELGTSTLLAACAVLGDASHEALAKRYAPKVGTAIMLANDGADPAEFVLEARAFGAVPLMPVTRICNLGAAFPCVLVVEAEAEAESLGLPML